MSGKSSIEWTEATWNPLAGCTRVSAGCDHCYAYSLHDKRHEAWKNGTFPTAPPQYHKPFSEVQLIPERLTDPLHWRKPRLVFVNSMSDLFHADVPDAFVAQVFATMLLARRHTFQVLTKRPRRMSSLLAQPGPEGSAFWAAVNAEAMELARRHRQPSPDPTTGSLPNVWLGTSVENQEAAYRLDFLVTTPAAVRFVSAEPLLGPLDFHRWMPGLDWIITGGESGPGHRPCDPDWVRSIRDQCLDYHVAYFHKQWGGHTPKAGGRLLDGREWNEMPEARPCT